jgi:hypothetical protein
LVLHAVADSRNGKAKEYLKPKAAVAAVVAAELADRAEVVAADAEAALAAGIGSAL